MPTMAPAPKEIRDAFAKYKETEEYANTRRWAVDPKHVDGSLWAAWLVGYTSIDPRITDLLGLPPTASVDEVVGAIEAAPKTRDGARCPIDGRPLWFVTRPIPHMSIPSKVGRCSVLITEDGWFGCRALKSGRHKTYPVEDCYSTPEAAEKALQEQALAQTVGHLNNFRDAKRVEETMLSDMCDATGLSPDDVIGGKQ